MDKALEALERVERYFDKRHVDDFDDSLATIRSALSGGWVSVEDRLPESGVLVTGYSPEWVDEDFNHDGQRECFVTGDSAEWISSKWVDAFDDFTGTPMSPTHWHYRLPSPPETDHE